MKPETKPAARSSAHRMVRGCCCMWYRFAVLTGCPALWLLDCVIAATGAQTYEVARKESWVLLKKMWFLYAPNAPHEPRRAT